MTNDLLQNLIHDVAIDWLLDNPNLADGENDLANLLSFALSGIKKSYENDEALTEKAVSRISSDTKLMSRKMFASIGFTTADTASCIVLSTAAWLMFHLRKSKATEYAMLIFGKAADMSPEYYDSHNFLELLSDYEDEAMRIIDLALSRGDTTKLIGITGKTTEPMDESKRPVYQIKCESGSNPTFYNDPTFRAEGDLITSAK